MGISNGSAEWQGTLKGGQGVMKPAHAGEAKFSLSSRFEGAAQSNPEELIGAALAGCFSMALTGALERAGIAPGGVATSAAVQLDKVEAGFAITRIRLSTRVTAPGLELERLRTSAEETKKTCPVSKALAGTTIELTAELA